MGVCEGAFCREEEKLEIPGYPSACLGILEVRTVLDILDDRGGEVWGFLEYLALAAGQAGHLTQSVELVGAVPTVRADFE